MRCGSQLDHQSTDPFREAGPAQTPGRRFKVGQLLRQDGDEAVKGSRPKPPMNPTVAAVRVHRIQRTEGGLDGIPHPLGSPSTYGELILYVGEDQAAMTSLKMDG